MSNIAPLYQVADQYRAMAERLADRAAADAEITRLREALIEVAATLSWQAFGDCRAFDQFGKSGPVLPSHAAESLAKDVLKGAAE